MKTTIRKTKGSYRVTFKGYPYWNTTKETRFEAEQYVSRVNAKIAASHKNPISWPA